MLDTAQKVLQEYFGHAAFRPNQQELIEQLLGGQDVLGVMPTGAGKSLVYQIPALVSDGLTLVVSPLISLMKDQVNALTQAGVRAAFLNSSISAGEQAAVLEYAAAGSCKLLYVAPERLDAPQFAAFCKTVKLSLIAIDEAHCVSQWGQDFRPSYLGIADFIARLSVRPPVCALTATATPVVQTDIAAALKLDNPFIVVSGFDRSNLYFGVERPEPKDKQACMLRLVKEHKGQSGVVYCSTRAAVEDVCSLLQEKGYPATRYHAGLSAHERHKNQDDFLFDRSPIMVATNAFGMGIDKSNVSFVVHYNIPSDVESYYQEAGRAGRDGEPADCVLIYNKKDVQTCQFLIDKGYEERQRSGSSDASHEIYERDCERLRRMVFYATTTDCLRTFILNYFGERTAPFRCEHCSNCSTEFDITDVTIDAQKILSCVFRIEQRGRHLGKAMIVDTLRGSKGEKLLSQGLNELSTYGIMSVVPAKRVRYILDALVGAGLLAQTDGSYPVICSTESGAVFLKERKTFEVKISKRIPKEEKAISRKEAKAASASAPVNAGLFELLKELRSKLATEANVPAYIVFSNATLTDMCAKMPANEEELLEVSGVGRVKAERYGAEFLKIIARWRS